MTLLEILLHELECWPEGKDYAFQSTSTSNAFFVSSAADEDLKAIELCQIATERGLDHMVTREQWQTAKIKHLPFFHTVANTLGEERAVKELLAAGKINYKAKELDEAFVFADAPQGQEFWRAVLEPPRGATKLKHAFRTVIAALDPDLCIRLQSDGSGSVRDQDDKEIFYFANPDSLVNEFLNPLPKFDHWDLLQDRFKWIAKDSEGNWWAYDDRPVQADSGWRPNGAFRSLGSLKIEIPCHWKHSLIPRPSTI